MHAPKIILLLLGATCVAVHAADSSTNQPPSQEAECGVVIFSIRSGQPIVGIERRQFYSDPYFGQAWLDGPKFTSQIIQQWQTNYDVFSKVLVAAAEKAHLDSASLAKILQKIRTAPENTNLVVLSVAAHETTLNGEPVLAVGLRWESVFIEGIILDASKTKQSAANSHLGHVRYFIFTRKTLKQVGFSTCK